MMNNAKDFFDSILMDLKSNHPKNPSPHQPPIFSLYADQDLYQDLIVQFVLGLGREIDAIETAIEEGNLQSISLLAHKTRGTAATFGYPELAAVLQRMEDLTKGLSTSSLDPDELQSLRSLLTMISSLCHRMVAALPPQ